MTEEKESMSGEIPRRARTAAMGARKNWRTLCHGPRTRSSSSLQMLLILRLNCFMVIPFHPHYDMTILKLVPIVAGLSENSTGSVGQVEVGVATSAHWQRCRCTYP